MYILFEGLKYKKEELEKIEVDPTLFGGSGQVVINKCGYFRPSNNRSPVFFLPKVFLNKAHLFLGQYKIDGVVDTQDDVFAEDNKIKDTVFSLSSWLYAAMRTYQKRMGQCNIASSIINNYDSQNIISNIGDDDYTQLDIIKALYDFYQKNNSLFVKISKESHSRLTKIDWRNTVNKTHPLFQDGVPVYTNMRGLRKDINYDEELITLFFSTLSYLSEKFGIFASPNPIGYRIIHSQFIEDGIDDGAIERHLLRIRRNYFSDRMRYLWQILFMFYSQEDGSNTEQSGVKYLLVNTFQNVFEDMIEYLIGDENLPDKKLKDQKDGHQIDHIFKYNSLIYNNESIYYVGDSKYYKETSDIQEYSEEKQYTYAHNVIKYNMDFFRNPNLGNFSSFIDGTRYRDKITEGYSITPNFFISGVIQDPTDYENSEFEIRSDKYGKPEQPKVSAYFDDRLFDRDTLFLQHYDINFLFVLSSYVVGNNSERVSFKNTLHMKLRANFIKFFNKNYDFYLIENPHGGIRSFVEKYFRILIGKIYLTSDNRLILALERFPKDKSEQNIIFKKLRGLCSLKKFDLE